MTSSALNCLLGALGHHDHRIQMLAVSRLAQPIAGEAALVILRRILQVVLEQEGPLLEHLADLFVTYAACTSASALLQAAHELVAAWPDQSQRFLLLIPH